MKEVKLDDLMSIEQIKEQLTTLGNHLLQNAINNTDGTVGEIRKYLFSVMDTVYEKGSLLDTSETLIALSEEVLDTLDNSVEELKPFN